MHSAGVSALRSRALWICLLIRCFYLYSICASFCLCLPHTYNTRSGRFDSVTKAFLNNSHDSKHTLTWAAPLRCAALLPSSYGVHHRVIAWIPILRKDQPAKGQETQEGLLPLGGGGSSCVLWPFAGQRWLLDCRSGTVFIKCPLWKESYHCGDTSAFICRRYWFSKEIHNALCSTETSDRIITWFFPSKGIRLFIDSEDHQYL